MNELVNESAHVEHILLESHGSKSKENVYEEDKQTERRLIIVFGVKAWGLITE